MKKVAGILMVVGIFALLLAAAPAAHAACGDPAGTGVNWSSCDKSNLDLSGATLNSGNFSNTNFANSNLNGALMRNAFLSGTNLSGAQIDGLDLSGAAVFGVDFTGAEGTPILEGAGGTAAVFGVTCPDGSTNQTSCSWLPAAVTLGKTSATAAAPALWPLALAGMLLLGTAAALLARRDERQTAVA